MNIHTADRSDVDAIRDVARQSIECDDVDAEGVAWLLETRFGVDGIDDRLDQPETVCVIAERGGQSVGFAEATKPDATVERLYVVPGPSGDGVGAALFEHLYDKLASPA